MEEKSEDLSDDGHLGRRARLRLPDSSFACGMALAVESDCLGGGSKGIVVVAMADDFRRLVGRSFCRRVMSVGRWPRSESVFRQVVDTED